METLVDLLDSLSLVEGTQVALHIQGANLTYAALHRRAERAGRKLAAQFTPGTRIGLLSPDRFESFELLLAAAYSGTVLTPLNVKLAPAELAYILNDARVAVLFVDKAFHSLAERLRENLRNPPEIIALDGESETFRSYAVWLEGADAAALRAATVSPDDVVAQYYTSGTTGRPKGVQLPHRSFLAVHAAMRAAGRDWFCWRRDDVGLMCLPFFHVASPWWAMACLAAGARMVVLPAFDPKTVLSAVAEYGATRLGLVPAMLQAVLSEPAAAHTDFRSLRQCFYGGSPVASALVQRAQRRMGCEFVQLYGLTETGNAAVALSPDAHRSTSRERLRAAGEALAGVDIKCVDARGLELPRGNIGEICIRSPANMVGYWNLSEATSEALQDGWLRTGDAGHIDAEGFLYVCDRLKDMVISAGENIYPAEVEEALLEHGDLAEAAVIGVPHERWGEVVKALVVVKPEVTPPSVGEILEHARARIAEYKLPRSIEIVASLPRTATGKVNRALLREPYWRGRDRQVN